MNKTALALTAMMLTAVSTAQAEPVRLDETDLAGVTAGSLVNVNVPVNVNTTVQTNVNATGQAAVAVALAGAIIGDANAAGAASNINIAALLNQ